MWLWARKITRENQGLSLLKPATRALSESDLPTDWKTRITKKAKRPRKAKKARKSDAPEKAVSGWDDTHKNIFDTMREAGWPVELDTHDDGPMARLHTCGLLHDHTVNQRTGRFSTNSLGKDPSVPNAYAFPRKDGGLDVYRHGDAQETSDWHTTKNGHTRILYNALPQIYGTTHLPRIVGQSIQALKNHPNTFQRGGILMEVAYESEKPVQNLQDAGAPRFVTIPLSTLRTNLCACAEYYKWSDTKGWVE